MPRNLKVCFATEDFYPENIGGQGIYGYHLVNELSTLGCELTVLVEKRGSRLKFWKKNSNIKVILIPFCFGNQLILALLEYLVFIWQLRKRQFDILHANQLSGLFFSLFKPKNVGKVVVSVHNTYYDLKKATEISHKKWLYQALIFLERVMYQRADQLLFHSSQQMKDVVSYYQLQDKSVAVVEMGVSANLTSFQKKKIKQEICQKYNIDPKEKIVLTVARLKKRKKIDQVIKAMKILQQEGVRVKAIIIGSGEERKVLESLAAPNTFFAGTVPYDELDRYYFSADLFVLTSVAEGGLSLAAMQAASFGLALVLSREIAGGILQEGENGLIIDKINPQNIALAIKKILSQKDKKQNSNKKIIQMKSWQESALETLNFYHIKYL